MKRFSPTSIALVILLITSFLLTGILVYDTFTIGGLFNVGIGDYELESANLTNQNLPSSNYYQTNHQSFNDILEPNRIIIRQDTRIFSLSEREVIQGLVDKLEEAPFNAESISVINSESAYDEFFTQDYIQIDLPTELPLSTLRHLLDTSPNSSFAGDIIMMPLNDGDSAYLLNSQQKAYVRLPFHRDLSANDLLTYLRESQTSWVEMYRYNGASKHVYLPIEPVHLDSKYFVAESIPELFVLNTSFPSSDYEVGESEDPDESVYLTFQNELVVNSRLRTMTYVIKNIAEEDNRTMNQRFRAGYQVLSQYEYWKGLIKLDRIQTTNQQNYRRHYDNLPIYAKEGAVDYASSYVSSAYSYGNRIVTYQVPLLRSQVFIDNQETKEQLLSGYELTNHLTSLGYSISEFEDIFLGYIWEVDQNEPELISLKPSWFFQYQGDIISLEGLESGGLIQTREGE